MYSHTTIAGRLGRDPETHMTPTGQSVTSFSVATSRRWTAQDGTQQEKTTWFRVTAWGKLGETCQTYLTKGRMVLVDGEVSASAYVSRTTGEPVASLELKASNVRFLPDGSGPSSKPAPDFGNEEIEEEIPF